MAFQVGQKVVYVGGKTSNRGWEHLPKSGLKKGQIVTIREIDPVYIRYFGVPGIRVFEEVFDAVAWGGRMIEPAQPSFRFRPVVERKTDISALKALLVPGAKIVERVG